MNVRNLGMMVGAAAVVLAMATPAFADGDATSALSVLPWNGAFLKISDADKRGTIEFGSNISALRYHVSISAPLDGSSRRAAFTDNSGLAAGTALSLSLSYSSILADAATAALAAPAPDEACRTFAAQMASTGKNPIPPCSEDDDTYSSWLQTWRNAHSAPPPSPAETAAELGKHPIPSRLAPNNPFFWEAGVDFSASYDRLSVYAADAAASPQDIKKWTARVGLDLKAYWAPWLAFTVKPGVQWSKTPSTEKFTRCESIPSSGADVTGQSCSDDALLLLGEHSVSVNPYFQWALTGVLPSRTAKANPGAEIGMLWDSLGGVGRRHVTATAFLAPTSEPVVTRFGVGLDISQAMSDDPNGAFKSGQQWWTPFVIVSGTL